MTGIRCSRRWFGGTSWKAYGFINGNTVVPFERISAFLYTDRPLIEAELAGAFRAIRHFTVTGSR